MREHIRTWRGYVGDDMAILDMWDVNERDEMGKWILAYRLMHGTKVIFEGADFAASPMHAVDSDETVRGLLSFLSLRPGDTDAEYFESYTPEQLEWAEQYGEELSLYAHDDGEAL